MLEVKVRKTPEDLEKVISDAPRNARGKMTENAAWYLVGNSSRGLQHYPPKPANSKYVRTYKLREGWGFSGYGATTKVVNPVEYAPYVQGDDTQAYMHVGRWRTVSQVIANNLKGMIQAAERALSAYLKEHGL